MGRAVVQLYTSIGPAQTACWNTCTGSHACNMFEQTTRLCITSVK